MNDLKQVLGVFFFGKLDQCLFFCDRNGKGLFKYDVEQRKMFRIREGNTQFFQYSDVACVDRSMVFAPYLSKQILIYDVISDTEKRIDLKSDGTINRIVEHNGKLIFVRNTESFLELDINTGELIEIPVPDEMRCNTHSDVCLLDGSIYYPSAQAGSFVGFSISSKEFRKYVVEECNDVFWTIAYANDQFWLSGSDRVIISYDARDCSTDKTVLPDDVAVRDRIIWKNLFSSSVQIGGKLLLSPLFCDSLVAVSLLDGHAETIFKVVDDEVAWAINKWNDELAYLHLESAGGEPLKDYLIDESGAITDEDIFVSEEPVLIRESARMKLQSFINGLIEDKGTEEKK